MKRIGTWMACGALTLAFSACDNDRTTDPDGGPIVLSDGGSDSGTPVMVDAGTDAGETDTCPAATVPPPTTAACAAETQPCIDGCLDSATSQAEYDACVAACFAADPSATPAPNECAACVSRAQLACLTANGCDEEYGEILCCAQANCPDGSCINTPGGPCASQVGALQVCAQTAAACNNAAIDDVCFPAAPAP